MGIIKRGILSGFRNKTGAVVGVRWRNLDVMRGMPRRTSKAFSQAQLDQQRKFSLLSQLLEKASLLINIGFAESLATTTPMNRAMAYNLKNPLAGVSPNLHLYYPTLSFSHGPRALPKTATIEGWTQARLIFNWSYFGDRDALENPRDLVSILVYCPATQRLIKLMRIATRADRSHTLKLPMGFSGYSIHAYLLLESANTLGSVSNTLYLGEVQVLH